ncbi:SNF2-related protein [Azospirillum doebereinerae]|uniref:DEAD/DEAH box helicase n=1 Tax=Azospirillum doebereinerae TaxID=92933 RepID=UPI003850C453
MTLLSSLRRHFDAGSYERGERYQRQGRVSALQADRLPDGTMRLAATVQGSQWIPYVQSVLLRVNANAVTMLDGECDCPVGINCKHVAAVAIAWASRPAEAGTASPKPAPFAPALSAPISDLLERLGEAAARDGGDSYPDTVRKRLLYVLRMEEGPNGREAAVCPLSVSLRKDDRFGSDDKPYATGWNQGQIPAKFVTPSDRAILQFMAQQLSHPSHPEKGRALRGEWAAGLVERMLRTGRLYWEDFRANPPLRPGPDRAGTARWTGDAKGRQRFDVVLDTPSAVVLPTVPLLYVDVESWGVRIPHHRGRAASRRRPAGRAAVAAGGGRRLPQRRRRAVRRTAAGAARTAGPDRGPPCPATAGAAPALRPDALQPLRLWRVHDGGADSGRRAGVRLRGHPPRRKNHRAAAMDGGRDPRHGRAHPGGRDEGRRPSERNRPDPQRDAAERGGRTARPTGAVRRARRRLRGIGRLADRLPLRAARVAGGEGWIVEIDPNFPYQVVEAPGNWSFEIGDGSGIDWFGLSLGVDVGGERVDLLPILRSVIAALDAIDADAVSPDDAFFDIHDDFRDGNGASEGPRGLDAALDALAPDGILFVPVAGNRFLPLEAERLRPLLGVLMELFGLQTGDGAVRIGRTHLGDLAALEEAAEAAGVPLLGADSVRRMARTLREAGGVPAVPPPAGLLATLRPYQQAGLDWLQFLGAHDFGGILADDMGLGKTVQALAHLLAEKEAGRLDRPCLLVAPTSVLGNWRAEAKRFAPGLRTLVLHGPQRKAAQGTLGDHDLVVTSYALLPRDRAILAAQPWHLAIFDEAQYLKNPTSQATKATHGLDARQRLCLSGTPVENNLDELWSLFSVAVPSLFGDRTGFRRQFRTPIEKHGDAERQRILARRVRPFLLRRTKEEVAGELPPKTEIRESVEPQAAQRDLYETIRLAMDQRVREEIARKGMARSHITILDALLKLRQACCDPRLVRLESARKRVAKGAASAKLDRLLEMLPDLLADGRRILLFSQFTSMLDLIKPELETLGIPFVELTGETRDRETPVRRFQAREVPLFLISLKAGGTGLNLTAADTVIHYDPWWNPAVEDQATDRAHRIGQDKPVFVYKLVTAGTVEERMLELQERKRRLGEAVYDQAATEADLLTAADIDFLLAPIDG